MFTQEDQEKSLRRQNEAGDAQAAHCDRNQMRGQVANEARQVGGCGKKDCAEGVGAKQKDGEKEAHCGDSRSEERAPLDRESREYKDVEQVREEQVPDEDRDRSDGYEGIHDVEIVVGYLRPEWPPSGEVIGREEVNSDAKTRERNRVGDLKHAGLGMPVVCGGFIVKEAREEMA